jgi:DNA polymerase III gamma/tau subunit
LFVKLRAETSVCEISPEEAAAYEELVKNLSPETIQAAYRSITSSLEEILRSPLPRASLEMALARLSGLGHLKSLEELLRQLESGAGANIAAASPPPPRETQAPPSSKKISVPVYTIPNPDPLVHGPEKKSAEPSGDQPAQGAGPSVSGNFLFDSFVRAVFQHKASLGAILEHALPVSSESQWKTEAEVKIGFRTSHGFYKLQALHKANFEQLEKLLQSQLGRKVRLSIETVSGLPTETSPVVSIVEKEKLTTAQIETEKKKKFLEHEIVKSTKEIFGAELSSFDVDKSKA